MPVAALVAVAAALVALARGLPAHTFYVGDPGVKLTATRNVIAHPARPLQIPLPEIAGEPVPWVDPFFAVHGGHSHAITPELFPLVSAPFVALFGTRGAYILPAAGLLVALAATAWLAILLDPRRSPAAVVLTAFLGTPLLFYGLEFWEHAPAAGLAALGAALFVRSGVRGAVRTAGSGVRAGPTFSVRGAREARVGPTFRSGVTSAADGAAPELKLGPTDAVATDAVATNAVATDAVATDAVAFIAGILLGGAALLRPEAIWFAVAVLACSPLLRSRPPVAGAAIAAAGIVAALLPFGLYTWFHFGSPIPPHLAGNPAIVSGDWLAIRRSVITSWFVASGTSNFWRVAPAVLLGFVPLVRGVAVSSARGRSGGRDRHGRSERGQRFLGGVALVTMALVVLTAPNDGGGQWAPRYLLLAYMPLAVLAADSVAFVAAGARRTWRIRGQRIFSGFALAAIVSLAVGSAWLQRASYKALRDAKMTYARVVGFVEQEAPPGGYVVTDLWWIDQVAASIAGTRTFLFVADPAAARDAVARLDVAREPAITLLRSRVESAGPAEPWLEGSCFEVAGERETPEGLVAIRLARSCAR